MDEGNNFLTTFYPRLSRSRKYKDYRVLCYHFCKYLDNTLGKTILLSGYDTFNCCSVNREIPYVHRFSEIYTASVYARFSRLEEWYIEHKTPVYLMSLTTSSRDKTIKEAFEILRDGWRGLAHCIRALRKKYGFDVEYLYVYEPHLSGYPHMHVLLFGNLHDDDLERLRLLWSEKYKIGSYEHGLNISAPRKQQEIDHVRAYVLKYVAKSMRFDDMTISHFVFLAVLWSFYNPQQWTQKIVEPKRGGGYKIRSTGGGAFRLWGASRKLTNVMKERAVDVDATQHGVNYARYGEDIPELVVRLSQEHLKDCVNNL